MRIAVTGSRVHRVWKCPASAILPQVVGDDSKREPARRRGKEIRSPKRVLAASWFSPCRSRNQAARGK